MGHGRRRPVPLKHSKTCDSFNEKSRLVLRSSSWILKTLVSSQLWPPSDRGRNSQRGGACQEKQDLATQVISKTFSDMSLMTIFTGIIE